MAKGAQRRRKGGAADDLPANPDPSVELPKALKVYPHGHEAHAAGITALKDELSSAFEKHDVDGDFIRRDFRDGASALTVARRLQLLDERVSVPEGKSASDHVRELFPELARLEIAEAIPPIPTEAPEPWAAARKKGEQLGDFVRRVYGVWIGHGLTKANIRGLDFKLYTDLYQRRNQALIMDLAIPALAEYNTSILEGLYVEDTESPLKALDVLADRKSVRRLLGIVTARRPHGPR